jgi:hypothetical protein
MVFRDREGTCRRLDPGQGLAPAICRGWEGGVLWVMGTLPLSWVALALASEILSVVWLLAPSCGYLCRAGCWLLLNIHGHSFCPFLP